VVLNRDRFKAFIVDMFMIYIPILYIVGYFIFNGRDDFNESNLAPFISIATYCLIASIFTSTKGQTPGYKAYNIKVSCENGEKVSFIKAVLRFILFLFSCTFLVGILMMIYRKDKKPFHDYILNLKVYYENL
jgi:uncharacterized RDD family membrane protein YckC